MSARRGWDLISRSDFNWILSGGGAVKRINISFFYELGGYLRRIQALQDSATWREASPFLWLSKYSLGELLKQEPVALTYCLSDAKDLHEFLATLTDIKEEDRKLDVTEILKLKWLAENFERSLITELRETNIYFVSPVGIFSTSSLLNKPQEMFFDNADLLPGETLTEIQEAAKCMAFSLATAGGFHLLRAIESTLRKYYDELSRGATRPARASMGIYLDEIIKLSGVDTQLHAVLKQIKTLHRDPIAHPEIVLTLPEAVSLLGLVQSAISRILALIKPPKS
jgi:hypothetical protein